ncbi:MAG: hypothetical protein QOI57_1567 [Rubrobacteraceae bacterium]|nr:hypothetical protein [Rubrobacteraceae bacterium]
MACSSASLGTWCKRWSVSTAANKPLLSRISATRQSRAIPHRTDLLPENRSSYYESPTARTGQEKEDS